MTAACVLAGAIRDALLKRFENPKQHKNQDVVNACQISLLTRNAFSHSMVNPRWSIDKDCRRRVFAIEGVITLDTTDLHDNALDWRDFGGPLAMFHFGRFVREGLFGSKVDPNRRKSDFPSLECYQHGRLILRRIEEIPASATLQASAGPGETIDLGDGYVLRAAQ